jgi:dihydroxyacetone kinase-like protein
MSVTTEKVRNIIFEIAKVINENKEYLSDLDSAIGDGDHGHNMARGFEAVTKKLQEADCPPLVGDVLKITAMTLISNVGGASGPLYGTLFLKMSGVLKEDSIVTLEGFVEALREGVAGVKIRGKAELGEKTMLDVLIPVLESLEQDSKKGVICKVAFETATELAKECVERTKDIKATKGRASYLGDRSIGHIDPGAMSSYLMLQTASNNI